MSDTCPKCGSVKTGCGRGNGLVCIPCRTASFLRTLDERDYDPNAYLPDDVRVERAKAKARSLGLQRSDK